jgi:hypothetical protein
MSVVGVTMERSGRRKRTGGAAMAVATMIEVEPDIDVYADCVKVWCDDCDGPALLLEGFCESCGSQSHDSLL